MANQRHLELIKQGGAIWNGWRYQHDIVGIDLSKADLHKTDLSEANLSGGDLSEANLNKADLRGANLTGTNLTKANLIETNLSEVDLSGAKLIEATLTEAYLYRVSLYEANLNKAGLHRANLSGANLKGANLSEADLTGASLYEADLSEANLSRAYLFEANFNNASLSETNFSRASTGYTIFGNVDLRPVKGLETVDHWYPSTIGTDTLLRSQGDIPEVFLRGAGLDDTFIEYVHSLTQRPIDFYSCFISYSTNNQDFAERLYADLQSNNVRCWYAPKDMKIGDHIRNRIDESIRLYDKLLLVLSSHSVRSSWVAAEVEAALEKERRHHKNVLFPVMLDDTVMRTTQAWAAHISRTRHIGDFTHWKEHDAYQKGLQRLLRDLKAESTRHNV